MSVMVPNTFYTWDDARTVTSSFWYKGTCGTANCSFDVMAQFCPKDGSGNPCCGGCPGSTAEVTSIDLGTSTSWTKATFTFQSTPGVPIHPLAFHFGTLRGATVYIDAFTISTAPPSPPMVPPPLAAPLPPVVPPPPMAPRGARFRAVLCRRL